MSSGAANDRNASQVAADGEREAEGFCENEGQVDGNQLTKGPKVELQTSGLLR